MYYHAYNPVTKEHYQAGGFIDPKSDPPSKDLVWVEGPPPANALVYEELNPIELCDRFLKANLPVEYRVQLGPSVSQALLHYQYGDYEAFTYLMNVLEKQVPEELIPIVKQCKGFFGL